MSQVQLNQQITTNIANQLKLVSQMVSTVRKEALASTFNRCSEVAVDLATHGGAEEHQQRALEEGQLSLLACEERLAHLIKVLDDVQKECRGGMRPPPLDSYVEERLKGVEASVPYDPAKDERFTRYRKEVWKANPGSRPNPDQEDDTDQELVAQDSVVPEICPITKSRLVEPVRSSRCTHTFSRKAIQQLYQQAKKKLICPVPGCNQEIRLEELERNIDMEKQLRRTDIQQRTQRASQSTQRQDSDDEEVLS
ncbi:hypothetical protein CAOG_05451 [Capsaspora owczarzaki ATCC 30864]|uniref:SP-RING-type domain-containing protein n=1 Tax=Capsaspora owczarzaki (strain ATCC 30864) TaxID=595528 RepID=A0A0D2VU52_CAPO3|nr:hypothetical protein CAOG_05451 [Capsaspora owczarzaki ATCC 30864]KJE94892.1 hypothetical protein CAOG_005451 [Capsaspora owczarzaki ATCC 30864]|eukprot:XP_004346124.1 hypothetical protein CAOG_05451 [Capsaspora owczarzaki ATCC 30864]